MSQSNISVFPGSRPRSFFLEIQINSADPVQWFYNSKSILAAMLEGFNEQAMPDGAGVRTWGVRLLSWLFPLPAQLATFPGMSVPTTPPPLDQTGGWHLIETGLVLRCGELDGFEELEQIHRALLALACFSGYELTDSARADFFSLVDALRPNAAALSKLILGKWLPVGYRLDGGEMQSADVVAGTLAPRADALRRVLAAPADRQNARYLAGFQRLQMEGAISEADFNRLLEWVAVGMEVADHDAEK